MKEIEGIGIIGEIGGIGGGEVIGGL